MTLQYNPHSHSHPKCPKQCSTYARPVGSGFSFSTFATPSSVELMVARACCVYDIVFIEDAIFTVYMREERQYGRYGPYVDGTVLYGCICIWVHCMQSRKKIMFSSCTVYVLPLPVRIKKLNSTLLIPKGKFSCLVSLN